MISALFSDPRAKAVSCMAAWLCSALLCLASPALGADLNDAEVKDLVRRSYPYVALYNVIGKAAFDPSLPEALRGFNKVTASTALRDHTHKIIARPNNDTLFCRVRLDLRADAVLLELPAFDSDYVSLEACGYDHYCDVVLSTRTGDFTKPARVLFYTARTEGYRGGQVPGVDRIVKLSCDFSAAFVRVMPHLTQKDRFDRILGQMKSVKLKTLSEYLGKPAKPSADVKFPAVGRTDADVFGTNLLEMMQFVFNHTTFDPANATDQGVLAVYKPLGVEPGKPYDAAKAARIDHARFRKTAEQVAGEELTKLARPGQTARYGPKLFRPKGQIDLETLVLQSVVGPIGLPAEEAMYFAVQTADGKPLNAQHDYVIRMTKDDLPPVKAFWSLTLYDTKNGFFIPNDWKKYSVGHNAGMKLDRDGGIAIHVAAEKPRGVPDENWLPINRQNQALNLMLRVYVPDLEKMKSWELPKAQRLPGS